jgi:hypothetical protein
MKQLLSRGTGAIRSSLDGHRLAPTPPGAPALLELLDFVTQASAVDGEVWPSHSLNDYQRMAPRLEYGTSLRELNAPRRRRVPPRGSAPIGNAILTMDLT